ncbi:dipeptide/oligopeptide/nickel ABC transporter permease/ATP-binding protein [Salinibacterium sp. SYSU T00001]|uniref:dipeptide/oligopeptide/nickel ABC transporter permease/ATP-binding protein n=1 Tax=Homoserinimonas sedimenticola TaxID=2986805 RepID=UPI00223620FE|nr:dipeptide/oligopeptide/nickel ABC transporter permease/ATP-binding protein [Salinibacterium sedimenticola]MCW4386229.1 dipeptide/oligopeptide/nickel ABC transporter permease/ATP-binding protein [Salinibacterium sedimenticola]
MSDTAAFPTRSSQRASRRPLQAPQALRTLLRSPLGMLGLAWLVVIVVASLTAPLWLPYPIEYQDFSAVLAGPSAAHLLGTDELGRDVLSRIFAAGAGSLITTFLAAVVAIGVALPLALIAAASSARIETIINRVTEIAMSIPALVIIIAVIGAVGTNLYLVMTCLGLLIAGGIYRVFVGQAKSLQSQLYVDAAEVDGLRPAMVSIRHILPNMATTIFVQFVLVFAIGLMLQAGLAFIGFGPQPPEPSWGGLIQSASKQIYVHPWLMVPTGLVLVFTVLGANAVADTLAGGQGAPPSQVALGPEARRRRRELKAAAPVAVESAPEGMLIVKGLTIGVDDGPELVSSVSFEVAPGTVLGVVGESGCGKTLTALSLVGLLPPGVNPREGSIRWGARDLARLDESGLAAIRGREIGFVGQEPMRALDPMFTIGYQLAGAVRRLRGVGKADARAEAASLLGKVGIVDAERVLRSYPHQISGGMAQRVAIALALAGRPKLLIADEPTTALDVTVQAEILSLLRGLVAETGMSMVMVTHDFGVVADICDEVVVMYAGQVIESGTVHDVLGAAEHPYTTALLAADPHAGLGVVGQERLASIPGQVPQPRDWPTGCRFADRCAFAQPQCVVPVPLIARDRGDGGVRCVRVHELQLGRLDDPVPLDAATPVDGGADPTAPTTAAAPARNGKVRS